MEATVGDVDRPARGSARKPSSTASPTSSPPPRSTASSWPAPPDYPDYYPELPGGKIGRAIEVEPFDVKRIGAGWNTCQAPVATAAQDRRRLAAGPGVVDPWPVSCAARASCSARSAARSRGKRVARDRRGFAVRVPRRGRPEAARTAVARMRRSRSSWSRTTGWWVCRPRARPPVSVRARRGVMLAGGGFDQNTVLAAEVPRHRRFNPSGPRATSAAPRHRADAGAAVQLMDDAWWGASVAPLPGDEPRVHRRRAVVAVLDHGRRGRGPVRQRVGVLRRPRATTCSSTTRTGPYWLVAEARHARRYLRSYAMDPRKTKADGRARHDGQGRQLGELAARLDMEPAPPGLDRRPVQRLRPRRRRRRLRPRQLGLRPLLRRPDGAPQPEPRPAREGAVHGVQGRHRRPGHQGRAWSPTPTRGSCRDDGSVIEGLYSAGNNSASVMGRTYPGPGSTIGPAVVFGLRAARHMARSAG